MNIYNLILVIVFLLIGFGVYKLFRRRSKYSEKLQSLSEEDLKPFFESLNLDKEKKVRKQWLISFFIIFGMGVVGCFGNFFIEEEFTKLFEMKRLNFTIILALFMPFLGVLLWFWITYYCSYKKRGTVWLMWTLIVFPLRELIETFRGEGWWNQAAEHNFLGWFIMMPFLGIEVLYWINCLRLYRLNSARKQQVLLALKAKYDPDASGFCT